jgi:hypothetical protein
MDCWQQISQFQQFLQCMLSQMGPIPLQGVTDGSVAKPGMIGEVMSFTQKVPFTTAIGQTQSLSVGVLSPGDWNCQGWLATDTEVTGALFYINPVPVGFPVQAGYANVILGGPGIGNQLSLTAPVLAASISVPTLIAYTVVTNPVAVGANPGNVTVILTARRAR